VFGMVLPVIGVVLSRGGMRMALRTSAPACLCSALIVDGRMGASRG
jgi:hypothetical protein